MTGAAWRIAGLGLCMISWGFALGSLNGYYERQGLLQQEAFVSYRGVPLRSCSECR